MEYHLIPII